MLYLSSRLDSLVRPRPQNILDLNFSPQKGSKDLDVVKHSMAIANLKKSEDFVTNTTAASKYIPRRPKISIN